MPARFALHGVVRHHRSHEPHPAVRLVARGPRGEVVARTRADQSGAFAFSVPLAALRGLRWQDPNAPALTVDLDGREEAVRVAGEPLDWPLSQPEVPNAVLWIRGVEEGPLQVLSFTAPPPAPDLPPEAQWVAALAGIATALGDGRLRTEDLARWLPPDAVARLATGAISDAAVELTRRVLDADDPTAVAAEALDLLATIAKEDPGEPWW